LTRRIKDGRMTVTVFREGDHWIATIADWWMAWGKTEAEAVKRVAENYEKEVEKCIPIFGV